MARLCLCVIVLGVAAFPALAAVPEGRQWEGGMSFSDVTATASSEDAPRWAASRAVDGDVSEPEGLWQTARNSPKSAWLELRPSEPRMVSGVRIFHQKSPRYYRSIDYTIACRTGNAWQQVADVKGNGKAGRREHRFDPVRTGRVRITITKSAHSARMGLNEAELITDAPPAAGDSVRTASPQRFPGGDFGAIAWQAPVPAGARLALSTRTAPDAAGKPGQWSPWCKPYARSGLPVAGPAGEWIQCRAALSGDAARVVKTVKVSVGNPDCVEMADCGGVLLKPGGPADIVIRFGEPMDTRSKLLGEFTMPNGGMNALPAASWEQNGRAARFPRVNAGAAEGIAKLRIGGAKTQAGARMMHSDIGLIVGTKPLLDRVRGIADWTMEHPSNAIFVEGYNQRTMLCLYEITNERRYLDHVRKWVKKLLDEQLPAGYWGTGYGDVYFADTGSALGLLINYYKFATPEERKRIDLAFERYFNLLLVKGDSTGKPFVHEDGSLGVGYRADKQGKIRSDLNKPYTIATALTGAEIFAARYYMHGNERHKAIAMKACDWMIGTTAPSGQIPYIIEDWNPGGKDEYWVWQRWPYDTSAYVGEGIIAAWVYIDDEAFRAKLVRGIGPHIEWVLRTQNADGSWAQRKSGDQLRSHGVADFVMWYYEHGGRDPRAAAAVRRYCLLLLDPERNGYLEVPGAPIATCLAGRALIGVVRPGVDCYRWKDKKP